MKAPVTLGTPQQTGPTDWTDVKRRILASLGPDGVLREFKELGLRVEGSYNSKGKAICHAMGREDVHASAFLNVTSGIYHCKGSEVETLNLFDFALKYGGAKFGDWLTTVKHYAELSGVAINARKDGKGRILESVYDYVDELGECIYQVLRYRLANGKKDFRQRRPDGRGGWVYDLEGTRRVLYQLPMIIHHRESTIYCVEGEKDADRLNQIFAAVNLPAIATTSAQGSNDTGRWESYAESLRDRTCIVIPDCDPTGQRHARGVCGYLHGVASSVKLVELPGVGAKGDVSDWLDQDNTIDDLWSLIVDRSEFDPATGAVAEADVDAERDATAADLIAADAGTRWLWPQWIPLGVLTLLTAEPSTGKTRLGLDLTKRIALGSEWPDGQAMDLGDRRPVVLWVPADSQHSELADAPQAFGFEANAIVLNTSVGDLYGGTELQESEQLETLEARIVRVRPAMVFIDTITNTSDAKSQDTADAKKQYKPLQEMARRTGSSIVCVTHTNIAGKTLGRRADEKTRVTIRMECPDPENQPNRRKLVVALSRASVYPPALGVTMGDSGNEYDGSPPTAPVEMSNGHAKGPTPKEQEGMQFLAVRLNGGPARVSQLRTEAEELPRPIAAPQLYAAKRYLGIEEFERTTVGSLKPHKWWRLAENHEGNGNVF